MEHSTKICAWDGVTERYVAMGARLPSKREKIRIAKLDSHLHHKCAVGSLPRGLLLHVVNLMFD